MGLELVSTCLEAFHESINELRTEVSNVRYGKPPYILFDFRGETYQFEEVNGQVLIGFSDEIDRALSMSELIKGNAVKA